MKNKATNIITISMIAVMVAISVAGCSVNEPEFTTIPTTATITETTEATTTTETTETETVATTTTETSEETSETTAATKATTKTTSKKTTKPTSKKVTSSNKKTVKKSPIKAPAKKPSKGYAMVQFRFSVTMRDKDTNGNYIKHRFTKNLKCVTTKYHSTKTSDYHVCDLDATLKAVKSEVGPNYRNYSASIVKVVKFTN